MSSFKFKCTNFQNFIRNSKLQLEKSLYGIEETYSIKQLVDDQLSTEQKIIKNLEELSKEDKIIWSRDSEHVLRGVVVENCTFSDYKILICKDQFQYDSISPQNMEFMAESYKISFIKGILTFEKIEYFSDPMKNEDVLNKLLSTIEKKLVQQYN